MHMEHRRKIIIDIKRKLPKISPQNRYSIFLTKNQLKISNRPFHLETNEHAAKQLLKLKVQTISKFLDMIHQNQ